MNKLAKLVHELEYDDLLLLKKDLDSGNVDRTVNKQLAVRKAQKIALCPVCHTPIRQGEGFYLEFGSADLRRKATFDAKDCLQYFIEHNIKK